MTLLSKAAALAAALSSSVAAAQPAWMNAVGEALGKPGSVMPGGIYRVGLPRSDIKEALDGVEIEPALALGSWLAFAKQGNRGMVMGDLVLLPAEVHFWANDDATRLAGALHAALAKVDLAKG